MLVASYIAKSGDPRMLAKYEMIGFEPGGPAKLREPNRIPRSRSRSGMLAEQNLVLGFGFSGGPDVNFWF